MGVTIFIIDSFHYLPILKKNCLNLNCRYSGSDGTTRDEANAQKQISSGGSGGYGKDSYETGKGNTNEGSVYYISPEGQNITLTWTADENGFLPKGDHLPVAPLPVALPYQRS